MTTVAVMATPPVAGAVLPALAERLLDHDEAARLYRSMLVDVCRAVETSGATLLVNYAPAERVPGVDDPETALQEAVAEFLDEPGAVRYEVQVGETWSGRVGNTVTHLLEEEGADSVGIVRPTAPFLSRQELGTAGMKLRSRDLVLGAHPGGGVYFAGFGQPIDFEDAYARPALTTLTDRGLAADCDVDFLPTLPVMETPGQLVDALVQLQARNRAGRNVPPATAVTVDELGLEIVVDGGELAVETRTG